MNRGIYALANGMITSQAQLGVISNNLANVNTSGFKSDGVSFNEQLEKQLKVAGRGIIGTMGSGPVLKNQFTNFEQGNFSSTANKLDFGLEGKGMFAVQSATGQVTYTRNGAFSQTSTGQLITQDGSAVLDASGKPIEISPGPFDVTPNGSIQNPSTGQTYGQIGIFNGTFKKLDSGYYGSTDATAQAGKSTTTRLRQGALETSNVSAINSMTQMIELGRNFDMAQKSMLAEDDMTQKLSTILS